MKKQAYSGESRGIKGTYLYVCDHNITFQKYLNLE